MVLTEKSTQKALKIGQRVWFRTSGNPQRRPGIIFGDAHSQDRWTPLGNGAELQILPGTPLLIIPEGSSIAESVRSDDVWVFPLFETAPTSAQQIKADRTPTPIEKIKSDPAPTPMEEIAASCRPRTRINGLEPIPISWNSSKSGM
jgi:hypothetical protein